MGKRFLIAMVRNYRREYALSGSTPVEKKKRASRNKVRRALTKKGIVRKGDGKDVDHKDKNPMNNNPRNLRVISRSKNRARK